MAASTTPSLYSNLRLDLPDPLIPWAISAKVFGRMPGPTKDIAYKVTQLFPTDPEWDFVWHHFHHDKPTKYSLGKVLIVHERHQQQVFEQNLSAQEREAAKFPPTWDQEPRADQRAEVMARWKEATAPFSPFESMESDGRRRRWSSTKVLPLFHGTREEICHSICESGHTFFGKASLSKNPGDPHNTDDGYFGSGIYFTNSARYAADIYSQGHLIMSWVSMREPFPFVGDPRQQDMNMLRGKGAYKHYNAHYVPVRSLDPTDPHCPEYYPIEVGQTPTYDEYVVFHPTQTLPRFWIYLTVDVPFLKTLKSQPQHVEDLIPHLMNLLQNSHVNADKKVCKYLKEKLTYLLQQSEDDYLDDHDLTSFHGKLQGLVDATGKVNRAAAKALTASVANTVLSAPSTAQAAPPLPPPPLPHSAFQAASFPPFRGHKEDLSKALEKSVKTEPKAQAPSLPPIAFGAAKWEKYFGLKVIEPSLPPDLDAILTAPCPFFPGKTVEETHFLTLIPKEMSLAQLERLTKMPKSGNRVKFNNKEVSAKNALSQHENTCSGRAHWVLMTKDVIPESQEKSWQQQQALGATFKGQGYNLLSIVDAAICLLAEYVQTGRRFYTDTPYRWTRCGEQVRVGYSEYAMCVGGFGDDGLRFGCFAGDVPSVGIGVCRKFF